MKESDYVNVPTNEHVEVGSTKSDQELFTCLKRRYKERKKGFKIYSAAVSGIHFVEVSSVFSRQAFPRRHVPHYLQILLTNAQFEIRPKSLVDCLEINRVPPPSKKAIEYEWEIAETSPPLGSNYLKHS